MEAEWEAELLPVGYFHLVYTLPAPIADIAYQNKRVIYNLLFKAAAEATLKIAADPKRLGARIGITAVLHTWGSALTHHPHIHPAGASPILIVRNGPAQISRAAFPRSAATTRASIFFWRSGVDTRPGLFINAGRPLIWTPETAFSLVFLHSLSVKWGLAAVAPHCRHPTA